MKRFFTLKCIVRYILSILLISYGVYLSQDCWDDISHSMVYGIALLTVGYGMFVGWIPFWGSFEPDSPAAVIDEFFDRFRNKSPEESGDK